MAVDNTSSCSVIITFGDWAPPKISLNLSNLRIWNSRLILHQKKCNQEVVIGWSHSNNFTQRSLLFVSFMGWSIQHKVMYESSKWMKDLQVIIYSIDLHYPNMCIPHSVLNRSPTIHLFSSNWLAYVVYLIHTSIKPRKFCLIEVMIKAGCIAVALSCRIWCRISTGDLVALTWPSPYTRNGW